MSALISLSDEDRAGARAVPVLADGGGRYVVQECRSRGRAVTRDVSGAGGEW